MAGREKFPAIVTPATAARDVKDTVSQIRQRIESLEAQLDSLRATSQQATFSLQQQLTQQSTPPASTAVTYAAGAAFTNPTAVYLTATNVVTAVDPTQLGSSFGCIGVTQSIAAPGSKVTVAVDGQIATVGGAGFTPFQPVFAGAAGVLTQTPPSGPAVIQVGVAITATLMLVQPGPTLLDALQLAGSPLDDLLPITRNPGVTWQLNGQFIGARRRVMFRSEGGIPIYAYDDPGNNQVVIVIGTAGVTLTANPLEDAWNWDYEEPEEDTTWWGIDDTVQGNNSAQFAGLVEDAWPWDYEEPEDDLWWQHLDDIAQRNNNLGNPLEDAWPWDYEEPEADAWWLSWDDSQVQQNSVQFAAVTVEDPWPWDYEEPFEDLWWHAMDGFEARTNSLPRPRPALQTVDEWWHDEQPDDEVTWWVS